MPGKFITLNESLWTYAVERLNPREDAVLADLREETARLGAISRMQIGADQGVFLALLVKLAGARQVVEVGTFTGYSSLCLARALPEGGRLVCFDRSGEWTDVARRYWQRAGVSDRIELVLGDATVTLAERAAGLTPDLVFIDADKPNYRGYYERLLPQVRPGGLVLFDNMLWDGRVIEQSVQDENVGAIRALNDFLAQDDRIESLILPVGDGIHLCRKK